jgi:hypothetical protein
MNVRTTSAGFAVVVMTLVMLAACAPPGKAVGDMAGPCEFFTDTERAGLQFTAGRPIDSQAPIRSCRFTADVVFSTKPFVSEAVVSFWALDARAVVAFEENASTIPYQFAKSGGPFTRVDIRSGYYYNRRDTTYLARTYRTETSCQIVFAVDKASSAEVEVTVGGNRFKGPACPAAFTLAPFIEGKVPRQPAA